MTTRQRTPLELMKHYRHEHEMRQIRELDIEEWAENLAEETETNHDEHFRLVFDSETFTQAIQRVEEQKQIIRANRRVSNRE